MTASRLGQFFEVMVPALTGEQPVASVARRLGPSPSGERRLELYAELVAGDHARVLEELFPSVRCALGRVFVDQPAAWSELTESYRRAHPAAGWEICRYGESFSEFLAERHRTDPSWPAFLSELADYHFTRYCAAVAQDSEEAEDAAPLDRTVFVRQYTHQAPQYAIAIEDDGDAPLPEAVPTIVIIYRALSDLRVRLFFPSLAALIALARRSGDGARRASFPDVSDAEIDDAEQRLVEEEVLAPLVRDAAADVVPNRLEA